MTLLEIAEQKAISRARLMVSGRYRIPFIYAGKVAQSLIRKGMIDEGGYLTPAALRTRSTQEGDTRDGTE